MAEYDFLFKTILIGNSGVGKTSIINRYVDKIYTENFISTIGVDFIIKTVKSEKGIVKLQIWDTAGQERFKAITTSYYRGAQCIFIVFDVTDAESFTDITSWLKEIKKSDARDPLIFLLGNKIDAKDRIMVTEQEIYDLIAQNSLLDKKMFSFISAKENTNIENIFQQVVDTLVERVNVKTETAQSEFEDIQLNENRKSCC